MPPKRRDFIRPLGERPYRKLFVIAVEGMKTEPQYFAIFNDKKSVIRIKCLRGSRESSPPQVLRRMKTHLRREGLKRSDEAWLVVDKDQWTDEQLSQLHAWARSGDNYGFALSNPKFEYWLLLHFEDGAAITSSRDCSDRLKRYLPDYDKGIDPRKITHDRIKEAIRRARLRDTPPCADWPRALGGTTVYKLVDNILNG
ncbi:MAG: RloB domain-containing protein [Thermoguttaceae bacterium]|nr:RloB domain-containing protein [Thermoguttaceae bacterium]MBR2584962.1 RloB domain-containing protein [Thermoguttaceae bacterium]